MIVAGTGHRPDKLAGGYSDATHVKLRMLAEWWLTVTVEEEPIEKVISGMALGWDTALAAAAIYQKIPLVAAVPFQGQEGMWPRAAQVRYQKLLEAASEVKYVCPPGYSAAKMQIRNCWMIDNCDTVLALFNGSKGGTANCLKTAQNRGRRVVNLWEQWTLANYLRQAPR